MRKNVFRVVENVIKIVILIFSSIFFIRAILLASLIDILLSIPFAFFLVSLFHELGHVITCLFTKTKVTSVKILFLEIDNKFHFINGICFGGSVKFQSNTKWKKLIYLMGPIFSLMLLISSTIIYFITFHKLLIVYIIISLLSFILVSLPIKGTDIYKIIKNK